LETYGFTGAAGIGVVGGAGVGVAGAVGVVVGVVGVVVGVVVVVEAGVEESFSLNPLCGEIPNSKIAETQRTNQTLTTTIVILVNASPAFVPNAL
jgi:hypothetical protein